MTFASFSFGFILAYLHEIKLIDIFAKTNTLFYEQSYSDNRPVIFTICMWLC